MKSKTKMNIIIAMVAFPLGLVVAIVVMREPMEPLTDPALQIARQQWQHANLRDYQLHYEMNGSEYEVEVRNGLVENLLVNGKWSTAVDKQSYSATGLLDLMELELENRNDPGGPFASQKDTMIARVRFNSKLGYVERYLRSGVGQAKGAFIKLIRFDPFKNEQN